MPKNSTPTDRVRALRKKIAETHEKLGRTTQPAPREMLLTRIGRYETALAEFPAHILRRSLA